MRKYASVKGRSTLALGIGPKLRHKVFTFRWYAIYKGGR